MLISECHAPRVRSPPPPPPPPGGYSTEMRFKALIGLDFTAGCKGLATRMYESDYLSRLSMPFLSVQAQ